MSKSNPDLFTSIILAIGLMNIGPAFAVEKVITYIDPACVNHAEDEIIDSKTFAGKLTGFVWGDFLHGEFVDNKGKPLSLFIETSDISCFLALHKDESLIVTYNKVCRYIENGAGIYPAEEIIQIKARKDNFKTWRKEFDLSGNYDACEKLEEKYTRKP
jgi:hypothetical protein